MDVTAGIIMDVMGQFGLSDGETGDSLRAALRVPHLAKSLAEALCESQNVIKICLCIFVLFSKALRSRGLIALFWDFPCDIQN